MTLEGQEKVEEEDYDVHDKLGVVDDNAAVVERGVRKGSAADSDNPSETVCPPLLQQGGNIGEEVFTTVDAASTSV